MAGFSLDWVPNEANRIATTPTSDVYRGKNQYGQSQVLKCLTEVGRIDERNGAAYLRWRSGKGCVRVIDCNDEQLLLEDAGTHSLYQFTKSDGDYAAMMAVARVIADLHSRVPDVPEALKPLPVHVKALLEKETKYLNSTETDLINLAKQQCRHLLNTSPAPVPLHGDLHHENLYLSDRGWIAIDPKGLIGDPAYEIANLFCNPRDQLELMASRERILQLGTIFSKALNHPVDRLFGWAFVHAMLSVCWRDEDGLDDPRSKYRANSIEVAEALMKLQSR